MCKTQLFNTVLQLVAKETEIPECLITSHSRATEVVDAKSILVKILSENGMYPVQISQYMHKYVAFNVAYSMLFNDFEDGDIIKAGYRIFFGNSDGVEGRIWLHMQPVSKV